MVLGQSKFSHCRVTDSSSAAVPPCTLFSTAKWFAVCVCAFLVRVCLSVRMFVSLSLCLSVSLSSVSHSCIVCISSVIYLHHLIRLYCSHPMHYLNHLLHQLGLSFFTLVHPALPAL